MTRVSVLVSVYGGDDYLLESIDSILDHTLEDFEFTFIMMAQEITQGRSSYHSRISGFAVMKMRKILVWRTH